MFEAQVETVARAVLEADQSPHDPYALTWDEAEDWHVHYRRLASAALAAVGARDGEVAEYPDPCHRGPMTAPDGSVPDLLTRLEQLRESAALGSLRVGEHYGIHLYAGENPVGTTLRASDAALIAAAVNAVPTLTAALRAAWELAERWERMAEETVNAWDRVTIRSHVDHLRAAITAALGPAHDEEGAGRD